MRRAEHECFAAIRIDGRDFRQGARSEQEHSQSRCWRNGSLGEVEVAHVVARDRFAVTTIARDLSKTVSHHRRRDRYDEDRRNRCGRIRAQDPGVTMCGASSVCASAKLKGRRSRSRDNAVWIADSSGLSSRARRSRALACA